MTQDAIQLDQLVNRCLGNINFAQRVMTKFTGRLEDDIEELKDAMRGDSLPDVARLAHRLKGASANVAAEGLRKLAEEIEQQARADLRCSTDTWFPRLEHEVERLFDAAENGFVDLDDDSSHLNHTPTKSQTSSTSG